MFENEDYEIDTLSLEGHTTLPQYVLKTFVTVAIGILITTVTSFLLYIDDFGLRLVYYHNDLPMYVVALQIICFLLFRFRLFKASLLTTSFMFFIYSVLLGFTFSLVQYVFDLESIYLGFAVSFVYFTALCVIGYTTQINLLRYQTILFIGLLFIVGFNCLCFFAEIAQAEQIACTCSLIVFTALTALDMKKLKYYYSEYQDDEKKLAQLSMYSALLLYLDLLNLIYTVTHIFSGFSKK